MLPIGRPAIKRVGPKHRRALLVRVVHCECCNRNTGHKRALGFGTFFAVALTFGFWLLVLPFYPRRCVACGTANRQSVSFHRILLAVALGALALSLVRDLATKSLPGATRDKSGVGEKIADDATAADPLQLTIGSTYVRPQVTSLVERPFEFSFGGNVLPPEARMTVLETRGFGDGKWYRVSATTDRGVRLRDGWVSAEALGSSDDAPLRVAPSGATRSDGP